LFREVRDFADDQFCSLPAPVPKPKPPTPAYVNYANGGPGYQPAPAAPAHPVAPINMASFNSRDQPCFHGDCRVTVVVDGGERVSRAVKHLRRGDRVAAVAGTGVGGTVRCVVRTECPGGRARLVPVPAPASSSTPSPHDYPHAAQVLLVTPWHPVLVQAPGAAAPAWAFPAHVAAPVDVPCDAVYSLLVEAEAEAGAAEDAGDAEGSGKDRPRYVSSVVVSGVPCLTLAHGIDHDAVASHPFFGTQAVVDGLRRCRGWDQGLVHFSSAGEEAPVLVRDGRTGLVTGWAQAQAV